MYKTDDMEIPFSALNNLTWTIHLLARKMGLGSLRFSSHPGMAFPCREVESINPLEAGDGISYEIQTNFGGLDGVGGPLPPWLNNILACEDIDNAPLGDFLNIFSHRFIEWLYLEWLKHRPDVSYQTDGRDRISKMLFSLLGVRSMTDIPVSCAMHEFQTACLLPYVGTLGHRPRSAAGLQGMLRTFFYPVGIKIKEFILRKVTVPSKNRAYIDGKSVQLGKNVIIGEQVRDVAGAFRIVVGPVNWIDFMAFFPGGKHFCHLAHLLEMYASELLTWDMAIRIKGASIPQMRLFSSARDDDQTKLGYNTWLISRPRKDDEIIFNMAR